MERPGTDARGARPPESGAVAAEDLGAGAAARLALLLDLGGLLGDGVTPSTLERVAARLARETGRRCRLEATLATGSFVAAAAPGESTVLAEAGAAGAVADAAHAIAPGSLANGPAIPLRAAGREVGVLRLAAPPLPEELARVIAEVCRQLALAVVAGGPGIRPLVDDGGEKGAGDAARRGDRPPDVTDLLSRVGHDLRNPLAPIVMAAIKLARTPGLNERAQRDVARISSNAERLVGMLDQLADFARLTYGPGLSLERAPVPLAPLARAVVERVAREQPQRRIHLLFDGNDRDGGDGDGGERAVVDGDSERLGQALTTLVANAVDHSAPETAVSVVVHAVDGAVVIAVESVGPPSLPEDQWWRPFRPSARGTRSRFLGAGLLLAHAIAERHGGALQVDAEGDGVRVELRLPIRA